LEIFYFLTLKISAKKLKTGGVLQNACQPIEISQIFVGNDWHASGFRERAWSAARSSIFLVAIASLILSLDSRP
jgi:hypothetical protein